MSGYETLDNQGNKEIEMADKLLEIVKKDFDFSTCTPEFVFKLGVWHGKNADQTLNGVKSDN